MDAAALVKLGLTTSIVLIVLALGLTTQTGDLAGFLRRPGLALRSLLAMMVAMPLVSMVIARAFPIDRAVGIALIVLAVSPVPPILPKKQLSLSGDRSFVVGLLAIGAALSIAIAPVVIEAEAQLFGRDVEIPPRLLATVLATTVFLPLAVGYVVHRLAPTLARRVEPWVSRAGWLLLGATVIVVLFAMGRTVWELVGNGTLLAMAAFAAAGLLIGHLLGGPDVGDRGALALATASRHPGVAAAIASAGASDVRAVAPAILLYLLVAALVSAPYAAWVNRRRTPVAPPPECREAVEQNIRTGAPVPVGSRVRRGARRRTESQAGRDRHKPTASS
jgi:BASS family bile acid:Na+ symporter